MTTRDNNTEYTLTDLVELLESNGYKTVIGAEAVRSAIAAASDGSEGLLCSGYRVFPDGKRCEGCNDCRK